MTTILLCAKLFREMSPFLDREVAIKNDGHMREDAISCSERGCRDRYY